MKIFNLPDLGEGLTEAEIVQWLVKAGDEIAADDPLVAVETDKAIVEIPSPRDGRIRRLCADEGDIVQTGGPLLEYAAEEETKREDSGTVAPWLGKLPVVNRSYRKMLLLSVAKTVAQSKQCRLLEPWPGN
jgi:pyruvate dehydrogenase E2 component (dihydrolipoamide acetyltransferase)